LNQPAGASLGAGTFLGQGINVWDSNARTPKVMQWNLNVQRELPWNLLVDVAYSGSRSEFFNIFNIANFGLPNTSINNPQFGRISATAALPRVIQFALQLSF
jgi:hypothetical protein